MFRRILLLLAFFQLASTAAHAQSCSFSVSSPMSFGDVDTLAGAAVDTTSTISVTCDSGLLTNIRVCLNIGAGSGGATSGTRHMLNGANILDYNLYQDAARSTPWGSRLDPSLGNPVALTFTDLLGSSVQNATVYGRVFGGQQGAATGLYASTFSGTEIMLNYAEYLILTGPPDCSTVTGNTQTSNLVVQANVPANCLVTAQDIDLGSHGILGANIDATGQIGVTCTADTAYTVGLNNGLNGDSPTVRRMSLSGESVVYGLYRDGAHAQPWGSAGGDVHAGTGAGTVQNLPVYARVPPQPTPSPGTYSDTVVITVTY